MAVNIATSVRGRESRWHRVCLAPWWTRDPYSSSYLTSWQVLEVIVLRVVCCHDITVQCLYEVCLCVSHRGAAQLSGRGSPQSDQPPLHDVQWRAEV